MSEANAVKESCEEKAVRLRGARHEMTCVSEHRLHCLIQKKYL